MANTITTIVPKLIGMMLPVLRANSILPRLVNRDFDALAAQKGQSITVPVPPTIQTVPVTPGATPPSTNDIELGSVQVNLDTWEEAPFAMTDKEMLEVENDKIPSTAMAALASLINRIDATIATAASVGAGAAVGTAGTTPFATLALALAPNKLLSDHRMPRDGRHVVFDAAAELNLLSLASFAESTFVGDVTAMVDGAFNGNRRAGAQWWMDQNVVRHTAGTGASYLVNNAAGLAVGATTIPVDTGSGTILPGDVVAFQGDPNNKYVVATALAGGSFTINAPGIKVAIPDNNAVTVSAAHTANLAFHRDAIVFASRPFQASNAAIASQVMADPISGLAIRMEVTREHKRDRWSLDALWGTRVVRPEGVVKILG